MSTFYLVSSISERPMYILGNCKVFQIQNDLNTRLNIMKKKQCKLTKSLKTFVVVTHLDFHSLPITTFYSYVVVITTATED